jgi:hypothetical protein
MIRRVGRPGLVGTMARTAVVAGTATAVSGGMVRHAQNKQIQEAQAEAYQQQQMHQQMQDAAAAAVAAQAPAAAPAPAPAAPPDPMIAKLQQLAELKAQGILSDVEFAAAKAKLLA